MPRVHCLLTRAVFAWLPVVAAAGTGVFVTPAEAAFAYRKALTIDNTLVTGPSDLTNFPVLVSVTLPPAHVTSPKGYDIIFRAEDPATCGGASPCRLDHEIESYNSGTGALVAWVRVPVLRTATDTVLYVYYGDAAVTCRQENKTGVWDASFREVFHLNETGDHTDSTVNGFTAVTKGTVNQGVAGLFGTADDFVGPTTSRLIVSDGVLTANSAFTMETWVRLDTLQTGQFVGLYIKGRENGVDWVGLGKTSADVISLFWQCCAPPGKPGNLNGPVLVAGAWYHLAATYDGPGTNRRLYVNGVQVATDTLATYATIPQYTRVADDSNGNYLDGQIDEVRFSNVERSADWIQTTYNNLNSPGTFYKSIGTEDAAPPPVTVTCTPPTTLSACAGGGPAAGTCNLRSIGTAGPYATGTVTATNGSNIVTGAGGTTWLASNRGRGDRINIAGVNYTVAAVDSDTQLRLTTSYLGATGAGKAYTITRQFATLQAWEDCISFGVACAFFPVTSANLVTDNRSEIGIAYKDSPFTNGAAIVLTFNGTTTDLAHTITLTADPGNRHNGIPGTGVIVNNGVANANVAIMIVDEYVSVEWMEITGGGGAGSHGLQFQPGILQPSHGVAAHNLIHNNLGQGIRYFTPDGVADIYDNFIYRNARDGINVDAATMNPGSAVRILNNTFFANGGSAEILGTNLAAFPWVLVRNNIMVDDGGGPEFTMLWPNVGSSHNLTGDAAPPTGPFTSDLPPNPRAGGVYAATEASLNFINRLAGTEDLHIQTGSTAIDAAANLGNLFPDDIDGAGRAAPWDVGADDLGSPTPRGTGCPAGTFWAGPNLIANPDFPIPGPVGFVASVAYAGDNVHPPNTTISVQSGPKVYTANNPGDINQSTFPGDPTTGAPATNGWLLSNGNNTGGPFMFWQQQVAVSPNTTYFFYLYGSNASAPGNPSGFVQDPIVQFFRDGSTTSPFTPRGTQVGVDQTVLDETVAQGDVWTRFQYAFTTGAAQTSTVLSLWDNAAGISGDYFSLSQVGLRVCQATTAVELQSFVATGADGGVDVSWATASELQNLGFHLYRSLSSGGPFERITSALIPGLGSSPTGASYSYRDGGLVNGQMYYYELEDVETTGRTERHGPVSATPMAGGGSGGSGEGTGSSGDGSAGRITYGHPEEASLRVLERGSSYALLELLTPGFYATPEGDGKVRLEVPGFESRSVPGAPAVAVKRTFVEAVAGRQVHLSSIVPSDEVRFDGLRVASAEAPELVVSEQGMVKAGLTKKGVGAALRGFFPRRWAQLLGVSFQGETKKARVELSPVRYDAKTGTTILARRLLVRVEFSGVETGERVLSGSRGRRPLPLPPVRSRGLVAELVTPEAGLYAVRFEDVFQGLRGVLSSSLRLSRKGQGVAYHLEPERALFGPGSVLYFVSEGSKGNAWGDVVYELETGRKALKMPVQSGAPSGPPTTEYVDEREWEENKYYQAGLLEAKDLWLWDLLVSPVTKSHPITLSEVSQSSTAAHLTVWLQGASDFEVDPDHHVKVMVNGQVVGEATWDGKTERVIEGEVLPGILQEGANTVSLENVGDTAASYSMVFLNRFSLSYPRKLVAEGGSLEGNFEQSGTAEVVGLGSGYVLDTKDKDPKWLSGATLAQGDLSFREEAGRKYLAVSTGAVKTPEVRRPVASSLRSTLNRADWVLLAPKEFLGVAQPLVDLRKSQGLKVKTVSLEQVYQEFGFGEESPEAIKDFLEYAYQSWKRPSFKYVVLLGDGSYDPKDYLKTGVKDRIPPFMVKTSYLWTASDPAYASLNGEDLLPDVAVGRLSAGTVGEAGILVEKIVAFERGGRTLGGKAVLIADNADLGGSFEADADDLASGVLAGREVDKVYLRDLGSGTRATILSELDNGPGLVSYVGHGGTAVWASENIFNNTDVASLSVQGQQPLLMTMNCLNGFFHFPPLNSLAEEFVKVEGKGAIAAFSPSGLSVDEAAHVYEKAVLQEIESGRHARLGDAILAAQSAYADSGAMPELLSIYHLFGDPALKIR